MHSFHRTIETGANLLTSERVRGFIERREQPSGEEFWALFGASDKFVDQEDVNWDFKEQWPFSYSDDYFFGIARLVMAFGNTEGGFIIFGVHDAHRKGGCNKVRINLDKFLLSLNQNMSGVPNVSLITYDTPVGSVDCLMVYPRNLSVSPYRFTRKNKYGLRIFLRDGEQVVRAEPKYFTLLYCGARRVEGASELQKLSGSIPPSPRTMHKFIGRVGAIDQLFSWLTSSDEPQYYLFGKGGSGKTTIAHEFGSLVRRYGAQLRTQDGDSIDLVIFLSAKEKSFMHGEGGTTQIDVADFADDISLYSQILTFSGLYGADDDLENKTYEELKLLIRELFNEFAVLLILDDIDTLTTKGIEVGTNYLFRIIARASRTSRMLCTQRNLPSHAINASIEVPGLNETDEFPEFMQECAKQYGVPVAGGVDAVKLAELSERRPLVVEYLIALVRSSGTYQAAFRLFEGDTGASLREYVFKREWSSLSSGVDSRNLLAALAILDKPVAADDLLSILQIGEGRLNDAVAATRAMFLQVNSAGEQPTYSLDALTRSFVLSEAASMDFIKTLQARIRTFEREFFPEIPQISRIAMRVNDDILRFSRTSDETYLLQAWSSVTDKKLTPGTIEHPQFKSLLGYVAARMRPPKLDDARGAFGYVLMTKYEPSAEQLRAWYDAERHSGIGFQKCAEIADFVLSGKRYTAEEKTSFANSKAVDLYHRAKERATDEPITACIQFVECLSLHCRVYKERVDSGDARAVRSEEFVRNTAYTIFDTAIKNLQIDEIAGLLSQILCIQDGYLDPIAQTIVFLADRLQTNRYDVPRLHRSRKEIAATLEFFSIDKRWMDSSAFESCVREIKRVDSLLAAAIKR